MKGKSPELQPLTPDQANLLFDEINASNLSSETKKTVVEALKSLFWLMNQYQIKKETIAKLLKKLFAKFTTEKIKPEKANPVDKETAIQSDNANKEESSQSSDSADQEPSANPATTETNSTTTLDSSSSNPDQENKEEEDDGKKKKKGRGRRSNSSFKKAKVITIAHSTLKAGDSCPDCPPGSGRLYSFDSGTILFILGQPPLDVVTIKLSALRCSSCQTVFKALLPEVLATHSRATPEAKAMAALLKYKGGVPFYRLDMLQTVLETRVTKSELWEMVESVAIDAMLAYLQLYKEAAKAETILVDDTPMPILDLMKENEIKKQEQEKLVKDLTAQGKKGKVANIRTGMFTTGIVTKGLESDITMYFTGRQHAGENFDDLLDERPEHFPVVIQACDASSNNNPQRNQSLQGFCNAHNRRNFFDLLLMWPKEITHILGLYTSVFFHDKTAGQLNDEERLKYHQQHSAPIMESLKKYCNDLLETKSVEPNDAFGKAIAYQTKHWEGLTLFLRIPNVPLTTNSVERALKASIRNRKNALFYKTEWGALVGDVHHSIIETCVRNNVNSMDYLVALQVHSSEAKKNPELWLPWNFTVNASYAKMNTERNRALDALLQQAIRPEKSEVQAVGSCSDSKGMHEKKESCEKKGSSVKTEEPFVKEPVESPLKTVAARSCSLESNQSRSQPLNSVKKSGSKSGFVKKIFKFKKVKETVQSWMTTPCPSNHAPS